MAGGEVSEVSEVKPRQGVSQRYLKYHVITPLLRLKLGWSADRQIQRALAFSSVLPRFCVQHLAARLIDPEVEDTNALDLFLQCESKGIVEESFRVWRSRITQGRTANPITEAIERQLQFWNYRPCAIELIRESLADKEARVRMAAARLIARMGDLDDIGLLSDLLNLPQANDEAPQERDTIIAAMKSIAERSDSD